MPEHETQTKSETNPVNIGILDYGGGNLRSVLNAFAAIGRDAELIQHPDQFAHLDLLVFPGQGSFGDSVRQLQEAKLWEPLNEWLRSKKPYLGFCLGYQLLFESSDESPGVAGLGIFKGKVRRFEKRAGLKVPHMGWNQVAFSDEAHPAWKGLANGECFYFVHSYYPQPEGEEVKGCLTDYDGQFASGVTGENLIAVQFHPEKSQEAGLTLLRNAVEYLTGALSTAAAS